MRVPEYITLKLSVSAAFDLYFLLSGDVDQYGHFSKHTEDIYDVLKASLESCKEDQCES